MVDSDFVFEQGEPVDVGNVVENNFTHEQRELVSDGDRSEFVFISGRGLGPGRVVLYSSRGEFHELNYSDMSIIRTKSVGFDAHGIGGDSNVVWVGDDDNDRILKYDYDDFTFLDSGSVPVPDDERLSEVGGDTNNLYAVTDTSSTKENMTDGDLSGRRWTLDPDTFSVTSETAYEYPTQPGGIGGFKDTVHFGYWTDEEDENGDPVNATLNGQEVPYARVVGAGGNSERVYSLDSSDDKIYVHNASDLSIIKSEPVPKTPVYGLGGV